MDNRLFAWPLVLRVARFAAIVQGMSVHIVKLCVGVDSIEELAAAQAERLNAAARENAEHALFHRTRMVPKRQDEILSGGSLYWVIRGAIQVRQRVIGFADGLKGDGTKCCLILLASELVAVRPTPRRAFQGWRYLDAGDAPGDLTSGDAGQLTRMPAEMRRELAELGLI